MTFKEYLEAEHIQDCTESGIHKDDMGQLDEWLLSQELDEVIEYAEKWASLKKPSRECTIKHMQAFTPEELAQMVKDMYSESEIDRMKSKEVDMAVKAFNAKELLNK